MFKKLNRIQKRNLLIGFLVMSLLFMTMTPYGSFRPTDVGFYASIFGALLWAILLGLLLNKYQRPIENSTEER
jgi:FtsH-binding integral membrane protein